MGGIFSSRLNGTHNGLKEKERIKNYQNILTRGDLENEGVITKIGHSVQSRSEKENILHASSRGDTQVVVQQTVAELDLEFGSAPYILM